MVKVPDAFDARAPHTVSLRCPSCRKLGSFGGVSDHFTDVYYHETTLSVETGKKVATGWSAGMRKCPNPACAELVFIVQKGRGQLTTYPAERLDFEPTDIPPEIVASFDEAITSHAHQCYKAAAIMVRRTLEEICADQKAGGSDLKIRIAALGKNIIMPVELIAAADELRLLGNDAAHLESRIYDDVGKNEVEIAIDLCKEILKAAYQYKGLLQRLRDLKK